MTKKLRMKQGYILEGSWVIISQSALAITKMSLGTSPIFPLGTHFTTSKTSEEII